MFKIFQRSKPNATSNLIAIELFKLTNTTLSDIQNDLTRFLGEYPEYNKEETRIREEIQWIPCVAGVLAVFMHSDAKKVQSVIEELSDVYESNLNNTNFINFTSEKFKNRIDAYFTRFNRGITFREMGNGKQALMEVITQAVFDCANEGLYFFTDTEREIFDLDKIMMLEVENRKPWGMLEMHVREVLLDYFVPYMKHLEKFRWS